MKTHVPRSCRPMPLLIAGLSICVALGSWVALNRGTSQSPPLLRRPGSASSRIGSESYLPAPPALPRLPPAAAAVREEEQQDSDMERLHSLHPAERIAHVEARLRAAAQRGADQAVYEAIRYCDEDPFYSFEYGQSLIALLGRTGDYSAALRFVLAEDAEGWLGENGSKWITSLFATWAQQAPQLALEAVADRVPPAQRAEALQVVAAIWAQKDPVALARFLQQTPVAREHRQLLEDTLLAWCAR